MKKLKEKFSKTFEAAIFEKLLGTVTINFVKTIILDISVNKNQKDL